MPWGRFMGLALRGWSNLLNLSHPPGVLPKADPEWQALLKLCLVCGAASGSTGLRAALSHASPFPTCGRGCFPYVPSRWVARKRVRHSFHRMDCKRKSYRAADSLPAWLQHL